MVTRRALAKTVWIDLERPKQDEVAAIAREFGLGRRFETEILEPSPVPLAAIEDDLVLLVLHFPAVHSESESIHAQEIDLIVGANFVLTTHYEVISALHSLQKTLETQKMMGLSEDLTTDGFLELVLGELFEGARDHTKHVAARLGKIEHDMFSGRERETVRSISSINREFLHLEAALADDEDPPSHFLKSLDTQHLFEHSFAERADRVLAERDHVARLLATHRAIAVELQETNSALLNATQNEIMKTLTVVSFIVLPLTFITGLFQMQLPGTPLASTPGAFWLVITVMAAIVCALTIFFARKRWL